MNASLDDIETRLKRLETLVQKIAVKVGVETGVPRAAQARRTRPRVRTIRPT
jgi:hypothetical protein